MYGTIALKLIIGMLGVIFFLRVSGKGQMAQITPLDTVSAFVIGALVGGVIYNPDMDAIHLIFALLVWTAFNNLIRYSLRFKLIRKLIKGDSIYIVKDGILNIKSFRRHGLEMEQFRTLLRQKDIFSMFEVDDVRFETNGSLSISKKGKTSESYLFVNNGSLIDASLNNAKKDSQWLLHELIKFGYNDFNSLYIVEWTPRKGFYIVTKDNQIIRGENAIEESEIKDEISA